MPQFVTEWPFYPKLQTQRPPHPNWQVRKEQLFSSFCHTMMAVLQICPRLSFSNSIAATSCFIPSFTGKFRHSDDNSAFSVCISPWSQSLQLNVQCKIDVANAVEKGLNIVSGHSIKQPMFPAFHLLNSILMPAYSWSNFVHLPIRQEQFRSWDNLQQCTCWVKNPVLS